MTLGVWISFLYYSVAGDMQRCCALWLVSPRLLSPPPPTPPRLLNAVGRWPCQNRIWAWMSPVTQMVARSPCTVCTFIASVTLSRFLLLTRLHQCFRPSLNTAGRFQRQHLYPKALCLEYAVIWYLNGLFSLLEALLEWHGGEAFFGHRLI